MRVLAEGKAPSLGCSADPITAHIIHIVFQAVVAHASSHMLTSWDTASWAPIRAPIILNTPSAGDRLHLMPPWHYLPPQPAGRSLWGKLGHFYIDSSGTLGCGSLDLEEGQGLKAMISWCQQGALPVAQPQAVAARAAEAAAAAAAVAAAAAAAAATTAAEVATVAIAASLYPS